MPQKAPLHALLQNDDFVHRHIGPSDPDIAEMLEALDLESLDALIDEAVPAAIRSDRPLALPPSRSERDVLSDLRRMAEDNTVLRSMIGTGYYDCITPPVILRNVLENPGWYTAYTPYQPEISQGRLEALLNFQTMVVDLTGMEIANASLLDEATAAAEAMTMCHRVGKSKSDTFFVSQDCHPQTIEVVRTRAEPLGLDVVVGDHAAGLPSNGVFGILLQYPTTTGGVEDYKDLVKAAHDQGALVCVAADLLALVLLTPPGEWGADIVVGSAQRFGVPLGFGGPHAAYIATHDTYKRSLPGRLVGVSVDARGRPALRLALQTREQHIRRERATSNICTAQVLLAVMAGLYAVYHGPERLRVIAERVHRLTAIFAEGLRRLGLAPSETAFFDTLTVGVEDAAAVHARAVDGGFNLRRFDDGRIGISMDETTLPADVEALWRLIAGKDDVSTLR